MGVLKTITDEYFGDSIREEDKIDISSINTVISDIKDFNNFARFYTEQLEKEPSQEKLKSIEEPQKTKNGK